MKNEIKYSYSLTPLGLLISFFYLFLSPILVFKISTNSRFKRTSLSYGRTRKEKKKMSVGNYAIF